MIAAGYDMSKIKDPEAYKKYYKSFGKTLMVSNVKVEKAAETFQVSDTIYTF